MQNDIAISVEHLSKRYMIGGKQHQWSIRDTVEEFLRHPFGIGAEKHDKEEFWALNDISFEIKKGDVVGIIGRNGSGKSTLLKILARIVEPTIGKITMRGRVASLLEVGTGFNAELTGRENIYLNGAILGMSQKEIAGKFDEIVAFSGVEQFIDTPVKRYSSGMYVRLAFAVAAHLDSDILLVDEVLAVGDQEFQKKCLGKMDSLAKSGKTVLFVSHDMRSIRNICKNGMLLNEGNIIRFGSIEKIINYYEGLDVEELKFPAVSDGITIRGFNVIQNNSKVTNINCDSDCYVVVVFQIHQSLSDFRLGISILTEYGEFLIRSLMEDWDNSSSQIKPGSYSAKVCVPARILAPGTYTISLHSSLYGKGEFFPNNHISSSFQITSNVFNSLHKTEKIGCHILLPNPWELSKLSDS